MKKYKVKVVYSFTCEWTINDENKEAAELHVKNHCHCIRPNYNSDIDKVSWKGDIHPSMVKIRR